MRQFLIALVVVWTCGCVTAFFYFQQQNIPRHLELILVPALLLELTFYLVPGFPEIRKRFDRIKSKAARAALMTATAVVPYLFVSLQLHSFQFLSFILLLTVAGAASFWYVWLKPSTWVDLLFLAFMAVVFLYKIFPGIYVRPFPNLQVEVLGRLMWVRIGLMSVLSIRRLENVRFGFVPEPGEWRIGIEQFLYFIPIGAIAAYWLRVASYRPLAVAWWEYPVYVLGTFLGVLWVLALAEEFFFRGFLQQLLTRGLGSEVAALLVTSVIFGLVHLPMRHFPNWRFAAVAGLAGLFYGFAFIRARSVRACMVTHALVVTTWRILFRG